MSGGAIYPDYCYHSINTFADELEQEINDNFIKDDWDYYKGYTEDTLQCMKSYLPQMRKIAEIMRACDYLYAGDYGEDSFMNKVKEIEEKYSV
jgi:hypothetical protein